MTRAWWLAVLVACGGDDDPCANIDGACIALRVTSASVDAIDQLELDVLYGDSHGTSAAQPSGGGTVELPLQIAIAITVEAAVPVGVVAAGKLAGNVLGTGAASTELAPGAHVALTIELAPPADCVAGGRYCGGDKLAGDPETLYQCNGGGVPLARGRCTHGCVVRPTQDDVCDGGPETCVEGGYYCGGNELDGDPQTLYRCLNSVATDPMPCANGCEIAAAGTDDRCR